MILGVDANTHDLVVAMAPTHPPGLPGTFTPSMFDASGLNGLAELIQASLQGHDVSEVAIVADLSNRTSPSNVKARIQLETALSLAAASVGCRVVEVTLGRALGHLDLDQRKGNKRGRLRQALEPLVGPERLSPAPARRASALGVALAAGGIDPGDTS